MGKCNGTPSIRNPQEVMILPKVIESLYLRTKGSLSTAWNFLFFVFVCIFIISKFCFFLDVPSKKARLRELFGWWSRDVTTLISKTREEMILHRDIYDRDMINSWGTGRVTLLGDAAHPMQPNLGLGGCLAIEVIKHIMWLGIHKKRRSINILYWICRIVTNWFLNWKV